MQVTEMVCPFEKQAEGVSAMAVSGLLFRGEFGEGLLDLGKKEQRIVAETIGPARRVQDDAFGFAVECCQSVSIARHGNHSNEAASAVLVGNIVQFAQQSSVVGLVD